MDATADSTRMYKGSQTEIITLFLLSIVVSSSSVATVSSRPRPTFIQIYPSNHNESLTPLYFGLAVSFGGDQKSVGAIPGIQLALDQINSDASILEGYVLKYTLTDSQVTT